MALTVSSSRSIYRSALLDSAPALAPSLRSSLTYPILCKVHQLGLYLPNNHRSFACRSATGANAFRSTFGLGETIAVALQTMTSSKPLDMVTVGQSDADYDVPMPIVLIDQDSDPDATIVQLSFGDRLGALIDTMKALKDLGLDVSKGTVATEGQVKQTKFFITTLGTGRKVEDPDLLERIRLTIINNLLKYHPESSSQLAMGEAFGIKGPEKKLDVDIATHIHVKEDGPKRSLLCIETADRPGLLKEIIEVISDVNIDVESAEIDTEGLVAKDKFHVSYRGAALNNLLSQVLVNTLRYYLRRPETDIDSY